MRFLSQRVQSETTLSGLAAAADSSKDKAAKPALKDLTPRSLLSTNSTAVPTVKQRQMLLLQKSGIILDNLNNNNNNTGEKIDK